MINYVMKPYSLKSLLSWNGFEKIVTEDGIWVHEGLGMAVNISDPSTVLVKKQGKLYVDRYIYLFNNKDHVQHDDSYCKLLGLFMTIIPNCTYPCFDADVRKDEKAKVDNICKYMRKKAHAKGK